VGPPGHESLFLDFRLHHLIAVNQYIIGC
jgi:hypothetical protein